MNTYPQKQLTLREVFQTFRRRRSIVYAAVGIAFLLGVVVCVLSTRRYQATGTIQVQRESSSGLDLDSLVGSPASATDALNADINLQTQASILQSDTLALRAIRNLKLEDTPEFRPKHNVIARVAGLFSQDSATNRTNANLENSPVRLADVLKTFHKNLSVKPIAGTRIIEIDYLNPDPRIAADVVNQLVQALVDYTFETRYNATETAAESLSKQLAELRLRSENLQAQVARMQRESGIYSIGTTDAQGRDQAYSAVLEQFQRAAGTLSDASQNRILKEAISQAAKSGDAEMLSSLAGNTLGGAASPGITNSLATIQSLRTQEATLQGQLEQLKLKFGSAYPKLAELQGNIDGIEHAIQQEVHRVAARAKNDYLVADQTWRDAQQNYNQQKSKADALNNKAIQYVITRQEAEASRGLYEDLLKRLKEAGILEGLKSNTITVVDPALTPARPRKPNVPSYLGAATVLGLLIGCAGVLLADTLDNKIQDAEAIEQMGLPLIGILPKYTHLPRGTEIIENPKSHYSEAIRHLRSTLMLARSGTPPQVILVTSAVSGEGKTTLSQNLAVSFVQTGKRVLLIEADMRRPVLRTSLGFLSRSGLSLLLSGEASEEPIISHPWLPELFLLPAGSIPPYPSELLQSVQMHNLLSEMRREFDVIVVDAAPTLPVTDSRVLNEMVDVTVQVVLQGVTTKTSLRRANDLLSAHSQSSIGIVLNGVNKTSSAYHSYYGYRDSVYYGKEVHRESA